ncbi:MAG: hypothetical protein N2322_03230 [Terrimicrobiaceae bacterium]|nr:hypothetical protein [Terrimicrobiaceae bacterium]
MIALRDNLPLLECGGGLCAGLTKEWLTSSVAAAAARAGHRKWWLAAHVSESVISYLQNEFNAPTISLSQLEKSIRSVLEVIGFPEIGEGFRMAPPAARISLAELARDAGPGYELAFFDLLRARLREALDSEAEDLEICEAQRGIKLLRSAKAWRRDCSGLLEEVVGFVRGQLSAADARRPIRLQLT